MKRTWRIVRNTLYPAFSLPGYIIINNFYPKSNTNIYCNIFRILLGALKKLRKAAHGKTQRPPNGFYKKNIFYYFSKICLENWFFKIYTMFTTNSDFVLIRVQEVFFIMKEHCVLHEVGNEFLFDIYTYICLQEFNGSVNPFSLCIPAQCLC
jgi:hypothetical protein